MEKKMVEINGKPPLHPGGTLRDRLEALEMSAGAFAHAIEVPVNRVTSILKGTRSVTADTALRFARFFDTRPEFWLDLQRAFDIRTAEIVVDDDLLERIPSQGTEEFRKEAQSALDCSELATPTKQVLEIVEQNLYLQKELRDLELLLPLLEEEELPLDSLAAPLEELRGHGLFTTSFKSRLALTVKWLDGYLERFQCLSKDEISKRLTHSADAISRNDAEELRLVASTKTPWFDTRLEDASIKRVLAFANIGKAVNNARPYDAEISEQLRAFLGDWRDPKTWTHRQITSLEFREQNYEFPNNDLYLARVPIAAFVELIKRANINRIPPVIERYAGLVRRDAAAVGSFMLPRTQTAVDCLTALESHIRRFIETAMLDVHGENWIAYIPEEMSERWLARQAAAAEEDASRRPVIAFADFADYIRIIESRYLWRHAFRRIFEDQENLRETFERLHVVHYDAIRGRPISQTDELLLYVETNRLFRQMESAIR